MKSAIIIFVIAAVAAAAWSLMSKANGRKPTREPQGAAASGADNGGGEAEVAEADEDEGKLFSNQYLSVASYGDGSVSLYFNIESDVPFEIGEKMEAINENAYMNGVAWTSLLNFILKERCPELLEDMETDPEAGTYAAYYPDNEEGRAKAMRLGALIVSLIENEEELYDIVRKHGDEIVWDE